MTAPAGPRLDRSFFAQPTRTVARALLGRSLVRIEDGQAVGGTILETEAYIGEDDEACHARRGRTPRTRVMYGPPGHAYLYFNYGMHWLLNIVTEAEGFPSAVLLRAIRPEYGLERIAARRGGRPPGEWTNGPGNLCRALGLDGAQNAIDLCAPGSLLFVLAGNEIPDAAVSSTPRVGLNNVAEPWKSVPWRFLISEPAAQPS